MKDIYLPIELVRHIISYVNDIDIRRAFHVYSKINTSAWKDIHFEYKRILPYNRITSPLLNTDFDEDGNPPQHISTCWLFNVDVYIYLHNLFDSEERTKNKINNDSYEVLISKTNQGLKYYAVMNRYVPINHFQEHEPNSERFIWKKIYTIYERPYAHKKRVSH